MTYIRGIKSVYISPTTYLQQYIPTALKIQPKPNQQLQTTMKSFSLVAAFAFLAGTYAIDTTWTLAEGSPFEFHAGELQHKASGSLADQTCRRRR